MRSSRLSNSSGPGSRLVTTSTNGAPALTRTSSGWKRFASMTSTTSDCGSAAKTTPGAAARALNASAAARAPITTSLGPTHGPRRLGVPNHERTVNFSLGEPLGLPEMPAAPSGSRRRSLDGELWREGGGEAGRRPCTLTGRGVDHVRLRAAARRDRAGARSRPRRRAAPRDRSRPGGARGPDRKSTRLNSSHTVISYAVFCLKKKNKKTKFHHGNSSELTSTTNGGSAVGTNIGENLPIIILDDIIVNH